MIYLTGSKKEFDGVINLELLEINYLDKDVNLRGFDTLIFTSQNSVKAINRLNSEWKNLDTVVIGEATSKKVKELGGKVFYISESGYGINFLNELKSILNGRNPLFIRAKEVICELPYKSIIVYETKCAKAKIENLEENSIIIFSSPSTIKCFFENYSWHKSFIAVVIGESSAKALPKNINYYVSPTKSIESAILFAKSFYSTL